MLLDEIKKMKEEIAKNDKLDNEILEDEEVKEEVVKDDIKEDKEDEEVKEEVKEEIKEIKEELDNAGYARLRREAAAAKQRAEQAEKEVQELRKAKDNALPIEEKAPIIEIPLELQSVVDDHRIGRAEREFMVYEDKVKKENPEFSTIMQEYGMAMYQSIRLQNPRKSELELNEMTKRAILMKAGEYAKEGYKNPVEELFYEAKELGYTGKSFQKEPSISESQEEKLQPDLDKVAKNRKRSTGMTSSNGRSEGLLTIAAATDLTASEWAKLPKAEKQRLLYGR